MSDIIPAGTPVKTWTVGKGENAVELGLYFFTTYDTDIETGEKTIHHRGFTLQPVKEVIGKDTPAGPIGNPEPRGFIVAVADALEEGDELTENQKKAAKQFLEAVQRKLHHDLPDHRDATISFISPDKLSSTPYDAIESTALHCYQDGAFSPEEAKDNRTIHALRDLVISQVDSMIKSSSQSTDVPPSPVHVIKPRVTKHSEPISVNPDLAIKHLADLLSEQNIGTSSVIEGMQAYYQSQPHEERARNIPINVGDAVAQVTLLVLQAGAPIDAARTIGQDMRLHYEDQAKQIGTDTHTP